MSSMIFFIFHSNCTDTSEEHDNTSPTNSTANSFILQEYYLNLSILPFSVVAICCNLLSLLVFVKQRFDNEAVKFNLCAISMSEILLQIAVLMEISIVVSEFETYHTVSSYLLTGFIHVLVNTAFCIRNWSVVLISVSRYEVIRRPLSALGRDSFFSKRRYLCLCQLTLGTVSLTLAIIYNLRMMGVICTNQDWTAYLLPLLKNYAAYKYFAIYGLFMYQSCLPILFILIFSFGIWWSLKNRYQPANQNETRASQVCTGASSHNGDDKKISVSSLDYKMVRSVNRNSSSYQRTNMLVLVFALTFCFLQFPTFLITCLLILKPNIKYTIHPDIFSNLFCILDSALNIFIYAACSPTFRRAALQRISFMKRNYSRAPISEL